MADHAQRRADDLDVRRLRDLAVHPHQGRLPAHPRRARRAPHDDRRVDRRRRAHARGGRQAAGRVPRAPRRRRRAQAEEIVQRARQTAESHEHEAREQGQEMLAEAAKRAERDIEAATKRALDDIRREVADLTIMATEKVTRKSARRGRPAAPRGGGARRARLSRASPRAPRATDGGARPRLRPLAVRGRPRAGQARRAARAARTVRRRARRESRARRVLLLALLLDRREAAGAEHACSMGADEILAELPRRC